MQRDDPTEEVDDRDLDWYDRAALALALVQTVLLPILVVIAFFLVFFLVLVLI